MHLRVISLSPETGLSCHGCSRFEAFSRPLEAFLDGQAHLPLEIDPSDIQTIESIEDLWERQQALHDLFKRLGGCPVAALSEHPIEEVKDRVQPGDCMVFDLVTATTITDQPVPLPLDDWSSY